LTSWIARELLVLWVAMMPVVELRGAIPLGISLGMSPVEAYLVALAGNLLPVPGLLLLLEPVCRSIRRWRRLRRCVDAWLDRSRARGQRLQRWGAVGLALFVALPLPSTGVWSGALIASLLGLRFWHGMVALSLGAAAAGILVTALSAWGLVTTP
jgi:uncharacterized membrane protein